jgi:putative copper export protein/methionine-rich copper-binding protein CopC/mono/diheme cytochrome c family protein
VTPRFAALLPLLIAAIVCTALLSPTSAEAHALLVRSDPKQNDQLRAPPSNVTAFFSEALDTHLSSLQVVDSSGDRVDDGNTTFGPEPERMQIGMKGTLGPGYYTVIWETLSAVDGHLFKGFYPFTMLNADGSQPAGQPFTGVSSGGTTAAPDTVAVRWARLLGIAALVGTLAFFSLVVRPSLNELDEPWRTRWRDTARRRTFRFALIAAGALVIVAIGELYLQLDQVGGLDKLGDVLSNDWGQRFIQRQVVLVGILLALLVASYLWRRGRDSLADAAVAVALIGGAAYILLIAMVSHGDALPGSFWAVAADFLHILAASVWVGMLFQLAWFLVWLRQDIPPDDKIALQASHLQRFGVIAATSVTVLLVTGVANAVAEIGDWSALLDTAYGRALLVKLGVLAVLLLVAAVNAFYLRPRIVEEADEGRPADDLRRRMSSIVRVELALGLVVLFVAAVLVLYPTSRQVRDAEAFEKQSTSAVVGFEEQQPTGSGDTDIAVDLTVSPDTAGQNSFRAFIFPLGDKAISTTPGQPGEILKVQLKFQFHGENSGQATVDMDPVEGNALAFKAAGPYLSKAGQWDVDAVVRRRSIDDAQVTFSVPVTTGGLGGQFEYPFTVGSWLTVAAATLLVLALIAAAWLTDWPGVPQIAPRQFRVAIATLTVLGAGVAAISLIPSGGTATGNPIDSSPQSIARGQVLYQQYCAQCHGINGDGNGEAAAGLPIKPADFRVHIPYHTDDYFFRTIQNGLGTIMPSWKGTISEEDTWNLINFLHAEFGANASPSSTTPAPTTAPSPSTSP